MDIKDAIEREEILEPKPEVAQPRRGRPPAGMPRRKPKAKARPAVNVAPAITPGPGVVELPTSVPLPAQFDINAFAQAIGYALAQNIPAIAEVMRQSQRDPEKDRIKNMRRMQQREDQAAARRAEVDRWLACDHMRTHPYSGTARIGWATQSDGVTRGTCMGCGCPFTPIEAELPDPARMRHLYDRYRGIPVSIARNDFLQGMVVAGNPA